MNCGISRYLYIRANGDIPCYDDAGEKIILGRVSDAEDWSIRSVLDDQPYAHIRRSLSRAEPPWPDTCKDCALFRPNERFSDSITSRAIDILQIEPSLACSLHCPACSHDTQIRERPKPFIMPPALLNAALRSLHAEGFGIRSIEYAGQGEPLSHPRLRELVQMARAFFPTAHQRIITNGNYDYRRTLAGTAVDEIVVSCDGLNPESYSRYRVGGDVHRVLQFMADIPKRVNGRIQKVVWKYILFEFNDSDEELAAAQQKAVELGVDQLIFVFTHSRYRSVRYTPDNVAAFPLRGANAALLATPVHGRYLRSFVPLETDGWPSMVAGRNRFLSWLPGSSSTGCVFMIDDFEQLSETDFVLRGWALATQPISDIQLQRNGTAIGSTKPGVARADVEACYPQYGDQRCGWELRWTAPEKLVGRQTVVATVLAADNRRLGQFQRTYE